MNWFTSVIQGFMAMFLTATTVVMVLQANDKFENRVLVLLGMLLFHQFSIKQNIDAITKKLNC